MAGQVLHVLDGDVLGEQVGDDHHAERVRADDLGQADIPEPALEHETDRLGGDAAILEGPAAEPGGAKQRGVLRIVGTMGKSVRTRTRLSLRDRVSMPIPGGPKERWLMDCMSGQPRSVGRHSICLIRSFIIHYQPALPLSGKSYNAGSRLHLE